jgi:DNA polymerase
MIAVELATPDDFAGWRDKARALVASGAAPDQVSWSESGDLFASPAELPPSRGGELRANRGFLELAQKAALHRDSGRFALLYRLLWRLQSQPRLLDDAADRDVLALHRLARQVRRDIHKMRAFVRFRAIGGGETERFVAWFEPEHHIVRANARFFVERFANQRWSILTPSAALHWDGETLVEGPGASRGDAPAEDATEELWTRYYRSIFNPARLKIGAMLKEMPRRYWKNMPEARAIADLVAGAQAREAAMVSQGENPFADEAPPASLADIASGIAVCRRCPIGCNGTQAVAGEGPARPTLMIVGEQPGDREEELGRPFVGPAGQVLDRHLAGAGIDRGTAWLTNAVKHFKFEPRGKRRVHQNPTAGEIDHCRWWLDGERKLIRPQAVLALGASAARGLLGRTPSIGKERGAPIEAADGALVWLTAHPSYLLRLDGEAAAREEAKFQADLAGFARLLRSG